MRKWLVLVSCVVASAIPVAQGQQDDAQPSQTPTFRTGVDVLAVDVAVTDQRGRPVEDLRAPEFEVRVDGEVRRVVSAELLKIDVEAARRESMQQPDLVFTTNQKPRNGRLFLLAVDQRHIRVGQARYILQAASRFVDNLTPADRVSFVAYPQPGPAVDFTDNKARVKQAMSGVVGNQIRMVSRLNIGMREAVDIALRNDDRVFFDVVSRECRGLRGQALDECQREILTESQQMTSRVREDRMASLQALREILLELARIDGPKTLVLMSEGLILEEPGELNDIIRLAALSRTSINVLLMDVFTTDPSVGRRPPTASQDRQMETSGLFDLAASTRGTLFNVIGSADAAFDRIALQTSAFYMLGVEEAAGDRDGRRHRIDVTVRRRDVLLHSRRAFVLSTTNDTRRTPEENLVETLRSPFAVAELPLRATTFVTQDGASDKVRLMVAAEVGAPGTAASDFAVGYAVFDSEGKGVTAFSERRRLEATDARPSAALEYQTAVLLEPGNYYLRVAAVDSAGRRGSVVHPVTAWQMSGETFAFGDLFVGNLPDSGVQVKPGVEPHVDSGTLAAFVELYSTSPTGLSAAEVTFEIAADQDAAPLASTKGELFSAAEGNRRVAKALLEAATLPPGNYLARARITRDGQPAGVLTRPFVLGTLRPGSIVTTGPLNLGDIARFDRNAVIAPEVLDGMLGVLATRGASLKDAVTAARAGRYAAAALEALGAGDQEAAQFLRGLDFYLKGQLDQAATQLHLAAGPRRQFYPAALLLGAAFAEAGKDRDAAGVWQLSLGTETRSTMIYAMLADARFRTGQPDAVVDILKPAYDRNPNDDQIARRLGLGYVVLGRHAEAVPVLDGYLSRNATDQDALLAAIWSHYETVTRAKSLLPEADRAKLKRYAGAYKGPQQALVARYLQSLDVR